MPSAKKTKRTRTKTAVAAEEKVRSRAVAGVEVPADPVDETVGVPVDLDLTDLEALPLPRVPVLPLKLGASGHYTWFARQVLPLEPIPYEPLPVQPQPTPIPIPVGGAEAMEMEEASQAVEDVERMGLIPLYFEREDLRIDVDGRYPQMVASGTLYGGLTMRIHWIANLRAIAPDTYTGRIWYKDGSTRWLPHTYVTIKVVRSLYSSQRSATVTFTGGWAPKRVRTYRWASTYFHPVEFEYDTVGDVTAVTEIDTGDHPNRPTSLATGPLSIETVYRRAGINASVSPFSGPIPISGAGGNAKWSDQEMHDAMQIYWSRFADKPQWALWVLFAALHEQGTSLGGVMFDDIGPNHRQGTAIFLDSFIANPPYGDPNPDAWVRRMKFWTAVHEIGHGFNLAHSWQKSLVYQGKGPWIPRADEPEARSFMNYPYYVSGGQSAFFANFEYRFTNGELLFLRHAPERFVKMGDALWFDHHGFEQAARKEGSAYKLQVRVHRDVERFEFMEPVMAELKLSNASNEPIIVNEALLRSPGLTVIVRRQGQPAKMWRPYAEYCMNGERKILLPRRTPDDITGEAIYAPLRLHGGVGGWAIDEPGRYMIQVSVRIGDEDVVSEPLEIKVEPPRGFEQELLAQDFFTDDVGRVLAFSGSRVFEEANSTLHEIVEKLPERRVAKHALFALATPLTRQYRMLDVKGAVRGAEAEPAGGLKFKELAIDSKAATKELKAALEDEPAVAVDTFGHIGYREKVEHFSAFLAEEGEAAKAAQQLTKAEKVLSNRGVKEPVLEAMKEKAKKYKK